MSHTSTLSGIDFFTGVLALVLLESLRSDDRLHVLSERDEVESPLLSSAE